MYQWVIIFFKCKLIYNMNRCNMCKKKLKIIDIQIKCNICNKLYCLRHRLKHSHYCKPNKEEIKKTIKKNNPKILKDKLEKI